MVKKGKNFKRFWSMFLSLSMVATTVLGTTGLTAEAADTFIEVNVPNGDFEDLDLANNAWNFTGDNLELDYYWKLYQNEWMKNNTTNIYEVCSKKNTDVTKEYTCSQTVTGLVPGTYKASIEATGGNDPGTHTTTFTAGGKSVSVAPTKWDAWITCETDTFTVDETGTCELVIASTVTGQYIDFDNVKLYRLDDGTGKVVDSAQDLVRKVKKGESFQAPAQTLVVYTDGSNEAVNVVWNKTELAAVNTATEGTYTVHGTVTVDEQEYEVILTVQVVDRSNLTQVISETATGKIDFDENWQFYLATRTPTVADGGFAAGGVKDAGDYTTEEIIDPSFVDADWRTVDVPHDFSIEGEKTNKSQDSQAYLQGGLAYYRKSFTVPESMKDTKTISLDFEGVYQDCVVYLNGEEVGSYPNGYTGFALDVTKKLNYGGNNVLVVKVQNMSPSGRWYTGSGILRPVHFVVDELAHFTREGITLSTPTLEEDYAASQSAFLNVEAKGYSDATNSNAYMKVTVYDAKGAMVAEKQTENMAINPSTAFTLKLTDRDALEISKVNLWYPWNIGDPYLYTVKAELYTEVNGSADGYLLTDVEEMEYGFRWVEVKESTADPASGGLYVNGTYTKVQGVDLHHDSGALGAASFTDAYDRQFDKLKDMGVNAYRTSHCPPSKQAIEVCRRKGIMVVEEAFDGWGKAKATYDFGNFFFREVPEGWAGLKPNGYTNLPVPAINYEGAKFTWSDWVVQEMVNRDKNEPSIIAWSIGNEVRGVGTKPGWYQTSAYDLLGVNPSGMNEYTEAVRLLANVNAADPTHYVLMGGDQQRSVPGATATWGLVNQVLDGYGLNYNTAKSVDGLIKRFSIGDGTLNAKGSKTFFFESESSSQTSSRGVYLDPQFSNTGINQTPGSRGGSNYDNDFASWTMSNEYGLKKDRDRKSFIGQFIWTGFDYLGEPTPYSVFPVGVASFGTIDTAGFPKDSFYLYQSQWVNEPMVHLLPQNWDEWEAGEEVEVWVNTNQQDAELFLNGKSLGKKSFDEKQTAYGKKYYETSEKTVDDKSWGDSSNPGGYTSAGAVLDANELNSGKLHLTWKVPYEPGTLEVKAYNKEGTVVATDSVTTSGAAYTILAEANKTVLAADGSSFSYVECTVVDENGNMVADAADLIKFDIEGSAVIAGVDNGQQESTELYKYGNTDASKHSERSAYNGKVLVILKSEKEAGQAVLTISADDLKPAQVTLNVTKDGTGTAPVQGSVTGRAVSADPVVMNVPTGITPVLPSAVRVHYTSAAGEYTLMRPVTWNAMKDGLATGAIAGETITANASVTEKAELPLDVELATNAALGKGNATFDFAKLDADSPAAANALATASFTGSASNYPNNMLDGDAATSWTNAYSRGASVLLPANSASRKSDRVEFYWKDAKVFNQVGLTFKESRYCAIPETLKVEYWNGYDWQEVEGQSTVKMSDAPTIMQFTPVYTNRVRVYMTNATPFSTAGNIEITEASVKLADPNGMNTQIALNAETASVEKGKEVSVTADFTYVAANTSIREISFAADYDKDVFETPVITLAPGVAGTLVQAEKDGVITYTYRNNAGIPENQKAFLVITLKAKAEAAVGATTVALADLQMKDEAEETVSVNAGSVELQVEEAKIEGTVTYLSSMDWVSAVSGWESVNKDLNCNGANSAGIALKVNGAKKTFEKGLGACADSEIIYDLTAINASLKGKEKLFFQSYVGVDYFKVEANKNGDGMYFIVYDGERELYKTSLLNTNSEAEFISLDITGVNTLRLCMDKNGTTSHDNGDWADAKLIKVPDPDAVVKTGLENAINAAEAVNAADYTRETYQVLADAIAAAKDVFDSEEATKEQVDEQITKLAEAVAQLKVPDATDYQKVLAQLQAKEQELATAMERADALNTELEEAKAQVEELEETVQTNTEALDSVREEVTRLTEAVSAKQDELDKARLEVIRLTEAAGTTERELNAAKTEVTRLEGEVSEKELELANAKQNETDLQTKLDESKTELTAAKAEVANLQEQAAAANAKVDELIKENDALKKSLEEAQKAAEQAKQDAAEALKAKEEAEKAKAEALAALQKAQEELAALKSDSALKAGDEVTVNGVKYRVTDAEKKLAEAYGTDSKKRTSIKVADTVKVKEVSCKVTAITKNAFKSMKKLKSAVIGKNVTSIGTKAFYGDKNLKKITVRTKSLKTVGKQAFKGISAKAVIKVPSSRKNAYKALLKGKGQKNSVKVK